MTRYRRINKTLTTFIPSSENNCFFHLSSMAFLLTDSCQTNASVTDTVRDAANSSHGLNNPYDLLIQHDILIQHIPVIMVMAKKPFFKRNSLTL